MINVKDLRIRDPFVYTDRKNGCYYLCGTTDLLSGTIKAGNTFSVYKSYDLVNFEQPKVIFDSKKSNFYGKYNFWAGEIHEYCGKFYLFGTVMADGEKHATQIFVCDTIDGEYKPLSPLARTPKDYHCIDATLYIDNSTPYMVFVKEWVDVKDGEICAVQLKNDLSAPVGEPFTLFSASSNPFVTDIFVEGYGNGNYVTDGPFLYKENGKLKMIWSSFSNGRYCIFTAVSNQIKGEWTHEKAVFDEDGGHAMIFYDLDGQRKLIMHSPNKSNEERVKILNF